MRLLQVIHHFDLRTFDWCLRRKHRQMLVEASRWVSKSADGYLYALFALTALLFQQWALFSALFIGFFIERVVYFFAKNQLKRNRPQQAIPGYISVIQPSDRFSFPSGHTSAAFLMLAIVDAFFPTAGLVLLFWAMSVGVSRVLLGVHFPTDTVAGAVMGYSIGHLAIYFLNIAA